MTASWIVFALDAGLAWYFPVRYLPVVFPGISRPGKYSLISLKWEILGNTLKSIENTFFKQENSIETVGIGYLHAQMYIPYEVHR